MSKNTVMEIEDEVEALAEELKQRTAERDSALNACRTALDHLVNRERVEAMESLREAVKGSWWPKPA